MLTNSDLLSVAEQSFDLAINSLKTTKSKLGSEFINSVNLICEANKVILAGIGKSGLIARKISATFSSIGLKSFFLHPVEALHGDIGMVEDGDVAILISKSGTTDDIIRLMPHLKARNVKIIGIASKNNTYLANNSDSFLFAEIERESCPFDIAPTTSTMLTLAIGDALLVATMKKIGITMEQFSRNHPLGQIGRNITLHVSDVMHSNEFLPSISSDSDLKQAIIEISNKGLGCVCVVDFENFLIGFITDGDIRRALQKYDSLSNVKAKDIMTKDPITISKDELLGDALALMENRKSQISSLPVVDSNGQILGVIRLHDIIQTGR